MNATEEGGAPRVGSCTVDDGNVDYWSSMIGVALGVLACVLYAYGNVLQRYGLIAAALEEGTQRIKFWCCTAHRDAVWGVGLAIYAAANGVYMLALSYTSVSVLAAVFALTIITNTAFSWSILGERPATMTGHIFVLSGTVTFSLSVSPMTCHYSAGQLEDIFRETGSLVFYGVSFLYLVAGFLWVLRFEDSEWCPKASKTVSRVLYPTVLGTCEAACTIQLKGLNSLATWSFQDGDSMASSFQAIVERGLMWTLLVAILIEALVIGWWLRQTYRKFIVSEAFPMEFGAITLLSVIGGFVVFKEHQTESLDDGGRKTSWAGVAIGMVLLIGGMCVVAMGKSVTSSRSLGDGSFWRAGNMTPSVLSDDLFSRDGDFSSQQGGSRRPSLTTPRPFGQLGVVCELATVFDGAEDVASGRGDDADWQDAKASELLGDDDDDTENLDPHTWDWHSTPSGPDEKAPQDDVQWPDEGSPEPEPESETGVQSRKRGFSP